MINLGGSLEAFETSAGPRAETGRGLRVLDVVDDHTRNCAAIEVDTSLSGERVARGTGSGSSRDRYPVTVSIPALEDAGTRLEEDVRTLLIVAVSLAAVGLGWWYFATLRDLVRTGREAWKAARRRRDRRL